MFALFKGLKSRTFFYNKNFKLTSYYTYSTMEHANSFLPKLRVMKLDPKAKLPEKGSEHAAGYDLSSIEETVVPAKGKKLISTGLAMAIPIGNYGRIAPRSGLSVKNFIHTGAGVVDADYRGEVKVLLYNFSDDEFKVNVGDRVA